MSRQGMVAATRALHQLAVLAPSQSNHFCEEVWVRLTMNAEAFMHTINDETAAAVRTGEEI